MVEPWAKFTIGRRLRTFENPSCQPLRSVWHVTHVPTALWIVEERRLRADLVFGKSKSKLDTKRIRVVWLSPNDWSNSGGFRSGNIRFRFDWAALIERKISYWVEEVPDRQIPTARILLTDAGRTIDLERYDPSAHDGPWWVSPLGEHYWNGQCSLEVLVEDDIDLAQVTEIDFVRHHADLCRIAAGCRWQGMLPEQAGAQFVAALVSRGMSLDLPGFRLDAARGATPSDSLIAATRKLVFRCQVNDDAARGLIKSTDVAAPSFARAVLASYGNVMINDDFAVLARQFRSVTDLQDAIVSAIASASEIPELAEFVDEW